MLILTWEKVSLIFLTWAWSFFLSLWKKGGKGIWIFSVEEGEEESLGGEETNDSFFIGSSFLEGDSEGWWVSKSLGTQSVVSPDLLDEPVSRGGEEEEEF